MAHSRENGSELPSGYLDLVSSEITTGTPFAQYGVDSFIAVNIIGRLGNELGRHLPSTLFWDCPTIDAVATHLSIDHSSHKHVNIPYPQVKAASATADEPVAIVGIGCRFPGSTGPEEYWQRLSEATDCVREIPSHRWNVNDYYHSDAMAPGRMNTRWAGLLDQVDHFDADFFGISPREARRMDPRQRLMLEVSWEALEDAGIPPHQLRNTTTGVFTGVIWNNSSDSFSEG